MKREQAMQLRKLLEKQTDAMTDDDIIQFSDFVEKWKPEVDYAVDKRVEYSGVVYKCAQAHTSQAIYPPNLIPSIWIAISLDVGTIDHPITAVRGMEYMLDNYYLDTEDGKIYKCIRAGVLQYLPHELTGSYFEEATDV